MSMNELEREYLKFKEYKEKMLNDLDALMGEIDAAPIYIGDFEELVEFLKKDETSVIGLPDFINKVRSKLVVIAPLLEEFLKLPGDYMDKFEIKK